MCDVCVCACVCVCVCVCVCGGGGGLGAEKRRGTVDWEIRQRLGGPNAPWELFYYCWPHPEVTEMSSGMSINIHLTSELTKSKFSGSLWDRVDVTIY